MSHRPELWTPEYKELLSSKLNSGKYKYEICEELGISKSTFDRLIPYHGININLQSRMGKIQSDKIKAGIQYSPFGKESHIKYLKENKLGPFNPENGRELQRRKIGFWNPKVIEERNLNLIKNKSGIFAEGFHKRLQEEKRGIYDPKIRKSNQEYQRINGIGIYDPNRTYTYGYSGFLETNKSGTQRYSSNLEKDAMHKFDRCSDIYYFISQPCWIDYYSTEENKIRKYRPDFLLVYYSGKIQLVEVKYSYELDFQINKDKWNAAKIWCNENNIEFIVMSQSQIYSE